MNQGHHIEIILMGGEQLESLAERPDVQSFLQDVAVRSIAYQIHRRRQNEHYSRPPMTPNMARFTMATDFDNACHLYGSYACDLSDNHGRIQLGESDHEIGFVKEANEETGIITTITTVLRPTDGTFPLAYADAAEQKTIYDMIKALADDTGLEIK